LRRFLASFGCIANGGAMLAGQAGEAWRPAWPSLDLPAPGARCRWSAALANCVTVNSPRWRELEETLVEAWPAAETAHLDGWLLRASGGPTHRGNSAATLAAGSAMSLGARIGGAEAWYRERDRAPMIQVGPCAAPRGLDDALAARGYGKHGAALMAVAPAAVVSLQTRSALAVSVEPTPSEAHLELAARSSRFAATHDVFVGFLGRLGARCRFVTAYDDEGRAVATCLGIASEQRLGVYAMLTLPAFRRRGAARAVLHALAESALADGLSELYLLVEGSNLAARNLYAQSGFQDAYGYHYRILE
jgi:ribosomal protein S18 acetylase RimI-like enzyme